ncbi:MAG: GGDEF domain-containing protein [Campylobacterota bacterium]|nr:GGDEF domain-containing protein [Campylobacterota bacterium]
MKKQVISKLIGIMVLIGITLTLLESCNFRSHGIATALNKAESISEVVKNGLTSHMINGNMDQRDIFLSSISNIKNVESIWIIRGQNVIKQYGKGKLLEKPRDDIDKKVLSSGKTKYSLNESFSKTTIRVTIPYNADTKSNVNCFECHNVDHGETLGAVSIIMNMSDIKDSGLSLALSILIFTAIAILFVLYFSNKTLKPHLETIDELSEKVKDMSNGKFTNIVSKPGLSKESENLIKEYNMLVNGLNTTFSDIDNKLSIFVGDQKLYTDNPLLNSQRIVGNLSDIYQFKKEIEIDRSKEDIYKRLSQILINKFNIKYFNLMELDYKTNKTKVVFQKGNRDYCSNIIKDEPELCRVSKQATDVVSVKDHKSCSSFCSNAKYHYCTSFDISDQSILIGNFVFDDEKNLNKVKSNISLIKSYFIEATPSLVVKMLLEALKDSAFKDGLTGLYNRKFLDEHLTKLVPQALRENINIGVLMLDMDHFKAVNDEYGHDVGDIVLKELARILDESVRDSDIVIRYGGEEFVVLLVGIKDEESALDVANKIRTNVSKNEINVYAGNKLKKTVSCGLSLFPLDSSNFDIVMKNADIALYEAKDSGRNKVIRFIEKEEVELF